MAKVRKGGKRTTQSFISTPNAPQVTPPTPAAVLNNNVTPDGGVDYNDFLKMTDDEKADAINDAMNQFLPLFLEDSNVQKLAYFTGLNTTPELVDDKTLDKMNGVNLYRTVHDVYDQFTDTRYTAKDIYNQIATGAFTRYSDSGGSAHGKGIYFANTVGGSASYASSSKGNLMMRAMIKPTAKTISESTLAQKLRNDNSKLGKTCRSLSDGSHVYALAKGYDIVTTNIGYYVVLNRGGLAMSKTTKSVTYSTNKW